MHTPTHMSLRMLILCALLVGAAPARAQDCFGSASWFRDTASGICITSLRPPWEALPGHITWISLDRSGLDDPILAGAVAPTSNVELALLSKVVLTEVGRADYEGGAETSPVDPSQALHAGALSEIFQSVPEGPGGVPFPLAVPSILDITTDPENGFLALSFEPGASIDIDFDDPMLRPTSWAAEWSGISGSGTLGFFVVLTDPTSTNLPTRVSGLIPLSDGFMGVAAPEPLEIARVRVILESGSSARARIDAMDLRTLPEPSLLISIATGVACVATFRKRFGARCTRNFAGARSGDSVLAQCE